MENEASVIISAFEELLDGVSFERITARSIAGKAGVPESIVYSHFESPYDVVRALLSAEEEALSHAEFAPSDGSDVVLIALSYALRHPVGASNLCASSARPLFERHVEVTALKYAEKLFSEKEPGGAGMTSEKLPALCGAVARHACEELAAGENVRAVSEKYGAVLDSFIS